MQKSRKLFKDLSISNKVSRNGFDLSFPLQFTAKVGELLPVMHKVVMPGDKFKMSVKAFTRTRPVQTAAFTSINEYYDFFFVPFRLIGKQLPHIFAQDKDNPVMALTSSSSITIGTTMPYIQFKVLREEVLKRLKLKQNEFGFLRHLLSGKLMNHLGYCWMSDEWIMDAVLDTPLLSKWATNPRVSLIPIATYQKIYYDFFRHTQWEDNVPYNYNFDYMNNLGFYSLPASSNQEFWSNPTMFDLRYANYPKDLFFGILPDSQYGDTAVVEAKGTSASNITSVIDADGSVIDASVINNFTGELHVNLSDYTKSLETEFSILEWRKANFVQKYREIIGSGRKDYKTIIQKIFNVDIPDTLSDMCTYLGGHSQKISISAVDNTNLVGDNSAIQRGKGVGSGDSSLIEFDVTEPGTIMCIYHAMPEITYSLNAFDFDVVKTDVDDFANPVFDKLGFQELPTYFLDNTSNVDIGENSFVGYTTRYFDYKTSVGRVLGRFRGDLESWVAPISEETIFRYNFADGSRRLDIDFSFFEVNPSLLNRIFDRDADSYIDTDQLMIDAYFSIHAVRNLDYIGLPY